MKNICLKFSFLIISYFSIRVGLDSKDEVMNILSSYFKKNVWKFCVFSYLHVDILLRNGFFSHYEMPFVISDKAP